VTLFAKCVSLNLETLKTLLLHKKKTKGYDDKEEKKESMSAAANSAAYWRIAGMSYLKYANACAEIVRGALKEPHLSKVRAFVFY
jgi:hypothetical protein